MSVDDRSTLADLVQRCRGAGRPLLYFDNEYNDAHWLALLSDVFTHWGAWVECEHFGPNLDSQVRAYQERRGLEASGVVDDAFWDVILDDLQQDLDRRTQRAAPR